MELFYQWIRDVLSVLQKNEDTDPKRIAIDGKAVRAAAANGRGIPYIISAYLGNYGLSIGQLKVGEKTNEIKEIPKLLKKLDISNCVRIYICILFIWIRIITLVSLLHLPTSVNYPQDIILHIPKAHPQPMK